MLSIKNIFCIFLISFFISGQSSHAARQNLQMKWAQCGGHEWEGPTECVPEAICKVINDWYSQCVPIIQGQWGQCGGCISV